MRKYFPVVGLGALLVLTACGEGDNGDGSEEAEAEKDTEEEEPETHEIDFEPQSGTRDESIIVEGYTNFKDGTEIDYIVTGVDNTSDVKEGSVNVEDGWFDQDIDVSDFSDGEVEVRLGYDSESQPDDVQEKYGQNGEYIEHEELMQGTIVFEEFYTLPLQKESSGEEDVNENNNDELGETIEDGDMTFTAYRESDDIDTYESGPINVDIEGVISGSVYIDDPLIEGMDEYDEPLEMIEVPTTVENTSDDDIIFYAGQATMTTDTGEQLEADPMLSDHIDGNYLGEVTKEGVISFVLEQSTADEVESIDLHYSGAREAEGNYSDREIWDDLTIEVDLEYEF